MKPSTHNLILSLNDELSEDPSREQDISFEQNGGWSKPVEAQQISRILTLK